MGHKTKTPKHWMMSPVPLDEYLKSGDHVDNEIVDYLRDLFQPITEQRNYLQVDLIDLCAVLEHNHVSTRKIYCTFFKSPTGWAYCGFCLECDTVDLLGKGHVIREDDGAYKFFDDSFLFFEECARRKSA